LKWVEVNIGVNKDLKLLRTVLLEFVDPMIKEIHPKIQSWHFLWESKPWSEDRQVGITLRLRFYGEDNIIDKIKQEIEKKLAVLEKDKPELYLGHCFGRHGECDKNYEGEADNWGTEAWVLGIKFLNLGSEVALNLIKNQEKLGKSEEYRKPISFYADRYVHCFLNQLRTLIDEINFYLCEAIQRISYRETKEQFAEEELRNLIKEIKDKIVNKARERIET